MVELSVEAVEAARDVDSASNEDICCDMTEKSFEILIWLESICITKEWQRVVRVPGLLMAMGYTRGLSTTLMAKSFWREKAVQRRQ